jgi:hypothetical protein
MQHAPSAALQRLPALRFRRWAATQALSDGLRHAPARPLQRRFRCHAPRRPAATADVNGAR